VHAVSLLEEFFFRDLLYHYWCSIGRVEHLDKAAAEASVQPAALPTSAGPCHQILLQVKLTHDRAAPAGSRLHDKPRQQALTHVVTHTHTHCHTHTHTHMQSTFTAGHLHLS
jgi:hypothetical protein